MTTMRLLERLRRRKGVVARVVLPLLAAVWFSASASVCFGMAAESLQGMRADAGVPSHDHSDTDHQHHQHDRAPPTHGDCPHCPAGGSHDEPAASHILCSVLDDAVDARGQVSALKWELEHLLPAAHSVSFSTPIPQPAVGGISHSVSPPHRSVALNIRHCVFLI